MRLLNTTDYTFRTFNSGQVEPYAILSHCWSQDTERPELTYQDVSAGAFSKDCPAWRKIEKHCQISKERGFTWAWVDTCCIDKRDSVELSEAINSMFAWYRAAAECYVFLPDLDIAQVSQVRPMDRQGRWKQSLDHNIVRDMKRFCASRWFARGWTLQELLAPSTALFFNRRFKLLGTKEELAPLLSYATGIDICYLTGTDIQEACVAQRMSWAANRTTTRPEDIAYCLFGIFDVDNQYSKRISLAICARGYRKRVSSLCASWSERADFHDFVDSLRYWSIMASIFLAEEDSRQLLTSKKVIRHDVQYSPKPRRFWFPPMVREQETWSYAIYASFWLLSWSLANVLPYISNSSTVSAAGTAQSNLFYIGTVLILARGKSGFLAYTLVLPGLSTFSRRKHWNIRSLKERFALALPW